MRQLHRDSEIAFRARAVKLLLMDCDGVMTDGRLYFSGTGEVMKVFNVRDGQGLSTWHQAGFQSGIISGRGAKNILQARATELGIHYIKAGSLDKARDFEDILQQAKAKREEVAYIGDDVGDIGLMRIVGFPAAVADADPSLHPYAIYTTSKNGGAGAVRELVELLLKCKKD
jgi:3-deoxy-D-manno-octulosonate 8-phosphate phosphatase (KDO 8-P phosphatase)